MTVHVDPAQIPVMGKQPIYRNRWFWVVAAAAAILLNVVLGLAVSKPAGPPPTKVTLTQVKADIAAGRISAAAIDDQANTVTLTKTAAAGGGKEVALYPFAYSSELTKTLLDDKHSIKTTTTPPKVANPLVGALISFLPMILILAVLLYLVKSGALTGGIGKFSGKRGSKLGEVPATRFSDVAGADEAVAELRELVEFLQDAERYTRVGAKPPRGALLVGPPGTGKTLLARAVAGEAGVPFFPVAGSDFVETFVGVGAKRTRDLFDRAREAGSAIIFIDEIDAIGRVRSTGAHAGESERENTLVSMLNEMDGFNSSHIIVLAATNRPDVLDPALTRPGRLDRQIQVPNPDRRGRSDILAVHAKDRPIGADVDFVSIARQTPGMSGAELEQVVNEACMEAARRSQSVVDQGCFQAAIAAVALGRSRKSALVTDHDRTVTAWHEAGHTVAALLDPDADDPVSVTIIPRGPSGGATWMSGNDNSFLTRKQALAKLTVAMAGRAAEERLMDGEYTQGASGDLQSATALATAMVTQYGMAAEFGYAQIDSDTLRMGGEIGLRAHTVINSLIEEAHARAQRLLAEHADLLERVASTLLIEETLSAEQVRALHTVASAEPAA